MEALEKKITRVCANICTHISTAWQYVSYHLEHDTTVPAFAETFGPIFIWRLAHLPHAIWIFHDDRKLQARTAIATLYLARNINRKHMPYTSSMAFYGTCVDRQASGVEAARSQ